MPSNAERGQHVVGTVDEQLLLPSKHRALWTKCFVVRRGCYYSLHSDKSSRPLLAARRMDVDKWLISDPAAGASPARDDAASGMAPPQGAAVAVCHRKPGEARFALHLFVCQNCDHRVGRYSCIVDSRAADSATPTSTSRSVSPAASLIRGVSRVAVAALDVLRATGGGSGTAAGLGLEGPRCDGAAAPVASTVSAAAAVLSPTNALPPARQLLCEIWQGTARVTASADVRTLTVVLPRVNEDLSRSVWCPRNKRGSGTGFSPGASRMVRGGADSSRTSERSPMTTARWPPPPVLVASAAVGAMPQPSARARVQLLSPFGSLEGGSDEGVVHGSAGGRSPLAGAGGTRTRAGPPLLEHPPLCWIGAASVRGDSELGLSLSAHHDGGSGAGRLDLGRASEAGKRGGDGCHTCDSTTDAARPLSCRPDAAMCRLLVATTADAVEQTRVVGLGSTMQSVWPLNSRASPIVGDGTLCSTAHPTDADSVVLTSRLPVWDDGRGSLTMRFLGGRVTLASTKNFLLETQRVDARSDAAGAAAGVGLPAMPAYPSAAATECSDYEGVHDDVHDTAGDALQALYDAVATAPAVVPAYGRAPSHAHDVVEPCLQFGKLDGNRYSLDYRFPLAPLQAFAAFLVATQPWPGRESTP